MLLEKLLAILNTWPFLFRLYLRSAYLRFGAYRHGEGTVIGPSLLARLVLATFGDGPSPPLLLTTVFKEFQQAVNVKKGNDDKELDLLVSHFTVQLLS